MEEIHERRDKSLLKRRIDQVDDLLNKLALVHKKVRRSIKPMTFKIPTKLFRECVIGGTFDRLHPGHEALICTALNVAEKIHIGIMNDQGVKRWGRKKNIDKIQDFMTRVVNLEVFLAKYGERSRVRVVEISDPFSYAVRSNQATNLDSIVVSEEQIVLERARQINKMREEKGLAKLKILRYPLILDDRGKVFSSSRLRSGEKLLNIHLPAFKLVSKEVIEEVRKPKGEMISSPRELPEPPNIVIAIGDIVVNNLIRDGYPISIGIIDKRSRRVPLANFYIYREITKEGEIILPPYLPVLNPPGTISRDAWDKIYISLFQEYPVIIRVYGEEDLLGFPATILAPDGSLIIYGQPPPEDKLVYFFVDEEHRISAIELLMKMSTAIF